MSYAAEKWVREQKTGNARAKAVLLELANCLNGDTGKCCPSIDHLSEITELQRHTVIAAIKYLVEKGFITKTNIKTPRGRGVQYEIIGFRDSVKTDTMGSVEINTTDSVKTDTRTSNKNKEIEHINTSRENSSFDDFSLEMSEPEKEEKTIKVQSQKTLDCPYEEIASIYNEVLGQYLGKCQKLTSTRKRHIKARWNDCIGDKDFDTRQGGLEYFRDYFNYIKKSDFLIGKSGNFRASFDWIFIEGNYTKICEGRYKNRPVANNYQR